jgi:hypothetical protein
MNQPQYLSDRGEDIVEPPQSAMWQASFRLSAKATGELYSSTLALPSWHCEAPSYQWGGGEMGERRLATIADTTLWRW